MTQDEGNFDDFMDGIGLDIKPADAEDALMLRFTGGGNNELHVFRYWLMHEMHAYYDALLAGVIYMRRDKALSELVPLDKDEYVIVRIKYYLRMKYLPWFHKDMCGLGIADIDKMAKKLLSHDVIQTLINTLHEDLPKLRY